MLGLADVHRRFKVREWLRFTSCQPHVTRLPIKTEERISDPVISTKNSRSEQQELHRKDPLVHVIFELKNPPHKYDLRDRVRARPRVPRGNYVQKSSLGPFPGEQPNLQVASPCLIQ